MKNYSEDPSKMYHIQVRPGEVGRYVLMPGDPKRCKKIARYLENPKLIADSREFVTYTGTLEGEMVSVTSSGIGGPSTAIAMEELSRCGVDTFIRVGSCGGIQPQVKSGDVIIATGAVRMEGTSREYAPVEYPAVASLDVTCALVDAAREASRKTGYDYYTGVVQCKDSFYGQHEPESMPAGFELLPKWEAWKQMGCLGSEMESAAMFIIAAKLHARAGTCLLVMANQEREKLGLNNPVVHDTDRVIRVAIEAMRILIREDKKKEDPENPKRTYETWLKRLPARSPMREELFAIMENETEIRERFYKDIAFGTAGLRGICGAGTNRMNRLTVGRATCGIANYILGSGADPERGVVIAYDCRYHSREFSEMAAEIFAGSGIHVYLFPSMRPTPELSFAVRKLGAVGGVNMTASHNPKEYNGYKVYWEDGAQISGTVSDSMQREIEKLGFFDPFHPMALDTAVRSGLVTMLDNEMDRAWYDYIKSMRQRPDEQLDKSVCVVYTPLHGAGSIPMEVLAQEEGYTDFHIVAEQKDPDPEFTTVGYPNPEDPKGFFLAEALGRRIGAEVLIATDPDADRMAVEIRTEVTGDGAEAADPDKKGRIYADGTGRKYIYQPLNGNQTGALLIAYMAQSMQETGRLPRNAAMIKSIVTGDMGRAICEDYGIRVYEALTGFKNICGVIPRMQADGYTYFFGYEESIGCAPGEAVRDKDGVCAALLVMEMAAWLRKKGMTVADYLQSLYEKYGWFAEEHPTMVLEGVDGAARIRRIMEKFRSDDPAAFGGLRVEKAIDYIGGQGDIPASDVLLYQMEDGSWFAMRPSGTEPKLKFYFYTRKDDAQTAAQAARALRDAVMQKAEQVN